MLLDNDQKGRRRSNKLKEKFDDKLKIIKYDQISSLGTGDLEIEDLFSFEFYLKAVNSVYSDKFLEKLDKECLEEGDFDKKSFRGIKNYFRLSSDFDLNKVEVAKEIVNMIENGEDLPEETISNFSALFELING